MRAMQRSVQEIIEALSGVNATARFFGVQPPSVTGWLEKGCVPRGRLVEAAARLEVHTNGWFSRKTQWPDTYQAIWPELGQDVTVSNHPS